MMLTEQTENTKAPHYFGVDFGLAFFGTLIVMVIFGFLGFYRNAALISWILTFAPSALVIVYRWTISRVMSTGAIAVVLLCLLFVWFIQGLGTALNGM